MKINQYCMNCFFKVNKDMEGKYPECVGEGTCDKCETKHVHVYVAMKIS